MFRIAMIALSLTAVLAATGAAMQAATLPPQDAALDQLTAVRSTGAAVSEQTNGLHVASSASTAEAGAPDAEPVGFTVGELHDGEVSPARFAAFWDAEVERIRTGACPGPTAGGTTVVVATLGATPPPHLGHEYPDYAPVLAAARAEAAAACA